MTTPCNTLNVEYIKVSTLNYYSSFTDNDLLYIIQSGSGNNKHSRITSLASFALYMSTGSFTGSFIGTFAGDSTGTFIGNATASLQGDIYSPTGELILDNGTGVANTSTFNGTSSYALNSHDTVSSSYSLSSSYASISSYSLSSSYSLTSSYSLSSSYAISSSYALTSSYSLSSSYASIANALTIPIKSIVAGGYFEIANNVIITTNVFGSTLSYIGTEYTVDLDDTLSSNNYIVLIHFSTGNEYSNGFYKNAPYADIYAKTDDQFKINFKLTTGTRYICRDCNDIGGGYATLNTDSITGSYIVIDPQP